MTEGVLLDVLRQSLWTALVVSLPILAVALAVGLAIGLIQALTSVQEMTLTFVPKILAMFMTLLVATPFMLATLVEFTQTLFLRIAGVDAG